jgi:hypothetical protein
MITDWKKLAYQLGALHDDDSENGNDTLAQQAFDEILGDEWIRSTVEHIISFKQGRELAMNCLSYLHSTKATYYAYQVYKTSNGERAEQAVWLIKHLVNPISFDWIEEFLNDTTIMHLGIGVLDQLLWTEQIPFNEKASSLLDLADRKSNEMLKEQTDFIRKYVEERNKKNL